MQPAEPCGRMLAALFVPHAFVEMRPVLEACTNAGWQIEVLLGYEGATSEDVVAWAQKRSLPLSRIPSEFAYGPSRVVQPPNWLKVAGRACHALWALQDTARHMLRGKRWINAFVDNLKPDILFTHNFRSCGHPDIALLRACRDRGIRTACMLVSPMVSRKISYMSRPAQYKAGMVHEVTRADHDALNRLVARLRPDWVAWDGGLGIFHVHPIYMIAARLAGLLPRDVWQVPSEDFDVVYAPTERSRERLIEGNYPADKIRSFGTPRLEKTYRLLADQTAIEELYHHIDIPTGAPFILWNMEPSLEHHYANAEVHWTRVERIRTTVERIGHPVVISLHPLCKIDDYAFLEETPNIRISRDYGIHTLYPFSAFSISFGCSTDRFAEAFTKKVLFYDWTGISTDPARWPEFRVENMLVARDLAELEALISMVSTEVNWFRRSTAQQQSVNTSSMIVDSLTNLLRIP